MLSLNEIIKEDCGLNRTPVRAENDFLISSFPVFNPTSGTDSTLRLSLNPKRYDNGISPSIPFETCVVIFEMVIVRGSIFLDSLYILSSAKLFSKVFLLLFFGVFSSSSLSSSSGLKLANPLDLVLGGAELLSLF